MAKPKIVVIGSINMDLVLQVPRLPKAGETLASGNLKGIPGGKGANQAVAAARLGGDVHMVGRVGTDAFAPILREGLERNGVETQFVKSTKGASGVAMILVQKGGENSIILSGGANALMTVADIKSAMSVIRQADIVILQLEIPLDVVAYAVDLCRTLGVRVILDPAPAPPSFPKALFRVDVLCPNESEAQILLGDDTINDVETAKALMLNGATSIVLKLGPRGSLCLGPDGKPIHGKPFKVAVVDTTAAGDSMTAGLAVAMGEGKTWPDALRFANAAGALACTIFGAQPSIPTRTKVLKLIKSASEA